jgi:hypothetical protein
MATEGLVLRKIVAQNLKYRALDDTVVLGLHHDPEVMKFMAAHGKDVNVGHLSVTRTRVGSTQEGTLRVEKFRKNQREQADFIAGIRLFTKMDVKFV